MENDEIKELLQSILDKIDRILKIMNVEDNNSQKETNAHVIEYLNKLDHDISNYPENAYVLEYLDKKGLEID